MSNVGVGEWEKKQTRHFFSLSEKAINAILKGKWPENERNRFG